LAQKAIEEGYEIVVAVGGDGSINEVAKALMNSEVVLGIIPAGSGNGLAMHLGYGRNIDAAIKKMNTAQVQAMDCGFLNGQPFFNIAGIGFDGMVSNMMKGRSKRGFSNYFLKSMEAGMTYEPKTCTIETAERTLSEKCFTISVANGPMYGYNFQIAPDAKLNDGKFEIVILKDAPRWKYFAAVPSTLNGGIYKAEFVEHFSATKVVIHCAGENYVHLDGEGIIITGDLVFTILPNGLKVLVPKAA
jgi:YegS/Rv2252/BmrU family lipid kinase